MATALPNIRTLHRLRQPGAFEKLFSERVKQDSSKKIVIDYSSPNIAKQFHIGNLRSTLLGSYIDRVHRLTGNDVTSINYLGDWGTQFAIIATYWPTMKPSDAYWTSLSDIEKIKSLTDCYVVAYKQMNVDAEFRRAVHATFQKMEWAIVQNQMDCEEIHLWNEIRRLSENHLNKFYNIFGVKFDHWIYESEQVKRAHSTVEELIDKKMLEVYDNRHILRLDTSEAENPNIDDVKYAILRKSNKTSLYLTREIAAILARHEAFEADRYLYVVDKSQRQHFQSLKIVLEKMGKSDLADKIEHVPYGRVRGLSTRHGKTEAVGEIIKRGKELALEFMKSSKTFCLDPQVEKQISRQLSLSTVIFNELKRAKNSEYEFSFKNAFNLNQNNAMSLQLKHTRLSSVEAKNEALLPLLDSCQNFPEKDATRDVKRLFQQLEYLETAIHDSATKLEPCQLTVHLVHIAHTVGKVATHLRVKDQPEEIAVPRLLLLSATRNVLYEGMKLLGIPPVRSM